jgi:uncharacterized protein (TIRG00374 family)
MTRTRAALLITLKIAISATLLWLVFRRLGSGEILAQLRQIDNSVVFALIPLLAAVLLLALRWHALALGLLTFHQALRYTFIGLFYGALLPGGVSGDIAKGAALALRQRSTRTAILPASILADRVIGLYVLGVAFGAACALLLAKPPGDDALLARIGAIGLLISAPLILLLPLALTTRGAALVRGIVRVVPWARLRSLIERLVDALFTYRAAPAVLLRAALLSAGVHAASVVVYLVVLDALQLDVPVHLTIVLYAVLSMLVMIPISISGLGVREWFSFAFFPAIGHPAEAGVAVSLTLLALAWSVAAIGGLWHLLDLLPSRTTERAGPL